LGDRRQIMTLRLDRAQRAWHEGDWQEALAFCEQALAECPADATEEAAYALCLRGYFRVREDAEAGLNDLQQGVEQMRSGHDPRQLAWALYALGAALVRNGNFTAGEVFLRESGTLCLQMRLSPCAARVLAEYAALRLREELPDMAAALLSAAESTCVSL